MGPTNTGIITRKLQIMLPLWFLWAKCNPWKTQYEEEKTKLLKYCYFLHGRKIKNENTILPRWWNESYVNYLVRRRYRRRGNGKESEIDVDFVDFEVGTDFIQEEVEEEEDDDDDDEDED